MKNNLNRWLVAAILIILIVGTAVILKTAEQEDQQMRNQLLIQARLSNAGINAAQVAALAGSETDLTSPDYQALKNQMAGYRAVDPDIRFVYLIGRRADDTYFFFVDSEPPESEDYSPPGQGYPEVTDIVKKVFSTGIAMTDGPATDRWGTWVSGIEPVTDPQTKKIIAVYGMDVDAGNWYWQIFVACLTPIIGTLLILVLVLIFFFIQQRNERERSQLEVSEKAIRESEVRYRTVLENVPDFILVHRKGKILYTNPPVTEVLGYTREELINKQMLDFIVPEYRALVAKTSSLRMEGKIVNPYEIEILTRSGERRIAAVRGNLIEFAGSPASLNVLTDITVQKRAENILKESEEKFHTLYSHMIEGAALHKLTYNDQGFPEDYIIIEINPAFEKLLGISRDTVIGKTSREAYGVAEPPYLEIYAQVALTGESKVFETYFPPLAKHFSISAYCPYKGTFATIFEDITDRKQVEEALNKSKIQLAEAMDLAHLVNWEFDVDTGLFTFDDRFYNLYGTTVDLEGGNQIPAEVYAKKFVHPDDQYMVANEVQKAIQTTDPGFVSEVEHRIIRRDGEIRNIVVRYAITKDATGRTIKTHGGNQDITELKKAEELLNHFNEELEQQVNARTEELNASLEEKVVLLREIHHRVKNNLQILISLLNLQSRTISDPQIQTALKESTQRIRAMSMVHEKLYSGSDLAHIDFLNYISTLAKSQIAFYQLGPGKITLEITGEKIILDINTAIPLGLAMNELLSNALKYAFPGDRKGTIRIDLQKKDGRLEISVADDGVGLPEGFDYTTSSSLGLKLVHILIEQLSGTIEIKKGTGTTFNIVVEEK